MVINNHYMEKNKMNKTKLYECDEVCVFCNKKIISVLDNNNAQPLKDGRCCSKCNKEKVLPERLKQCFGGF